VRSTPRPRAGRLWLACLGRRLIEPLRVNGITTGTINWQTFSHLAFAFRTTPDLLAAGIAFALAMGLAGGLSPAIRAARANVAHTRRAL
jgi:putative ABC transport system permease protein